MIQTILDFKVQNVDMQATQIDPENRLVPEIRKKIVEMKDAFVTRHKEDEAMQQSLFMTQSDQVRIIRMYFFEKKSKRFIYQNYRYSKYEVDMIINTFKKTGKFTPYSSKRKKLIMPPLDQLKKKATSRYFHMGSLGDTIGEFSEYIKMGFPDYFSLFKTETIAKHLRKALKLKKMKSTKLSTKVSVEEQYRSTICFSGITTELLKNETHVIFVDGFSW